MTNPSPQQPSTVEQKLLRAMMTAPNCLTEKTINGTAKNIFEIHDYRVLVAAINELRRQDMEYVIGRDIQGGAFGETGLTPDYHIEEYNRVLKVQRKRMKKRLNEPE
jgi:hypothetical protein